MREGVAARDAAGLLPAARYRNTDSATTVLQKLIGLYPQQ